MPEKSETFAYFISQKNELVVVGFTGLLTKSDAAKLQDCLVEIQALNTAKCVVLHLAGVADIASDTIAQFALLQKELRNSCEIRLSGLNAILREKLLKVGVVRNAEIAESIAAAYQSLQQSQKKEGLPRGQKNFSSPLPAKKHAA